MDPISLAVTLGQFVPQIIKWLGGAKAASAAQIAQKAVDIATQVTGKPADQAVAALQANPDLVLQYRKAIMDQQVQFEQLAEANASDINKTMQAEAAANHWPTYSWRPAIGFAVSIVLVACAAVILIAYSGVIFAKRDPTSLAYIPGMLGAVAALLGAGAMPVLGIASWFRGKMQADPNIPTDNRG